MKTTEPETTETEQPGGVGAAAEPEAERMRDNEVTWSKLMFWGMIPALGIVFSAGGGWWAQADLAHRLDQVEVRIRTQESVGSPGHERRVTELEAANGELEDRLRSMERDVIAICIATDAKCE